MTGTHSLRKPLTVLIAIIAWSALAVQMGLVVQSVMAEGKSPLTGVINTLSYFTILTNILVAVVCTASVFRDNTFLTLPSTLSAVEVYIVVVGLTYSLLLRSVWDPTGLQAVADTCLHDITPILFTVFWIFFVPKGTLRWSQPLRWLAYPVVYMVYCLVRGAIVHVYPYHFVDPILLGYSRALLNAGFLLIFFWLLGIVLVFLDRRAARPAPLV